MRTLRVALGQINATVGDLERQKRRIAEQAEELVRRAGQLDQKAKTLE